MTLRSLYKQNRYFFIGYFILLIIALYILIFYSKADGFVLMNPYHSDLFNYFFIPYTYVGDGFFIIALALVLFFLRKKYLSLMIVSSYLISGIFVQALKSFISEARPAYFLANTNYPYFIENVTLHNYHSFPSGHSASAFALAAVLSFSVKNKNYSMIFLFLAALVGYSRIYLGQHFMDDVLPGSFLGMISAIICWMCFEKFFMKILKMNSAQSKLETTK